ncbi:hypothetical protein Lser_V15G05599 [Lactuca serriola]
MSIGRLFSIDDPHCLRAHCGSSYSSSPVFSSIVFVPNRVV